jgi:hypothetical protein
MSATIIYPSQGKDVNSFQATAYFACREIYDSKSTVFKTVYVKPNSVSFVLDAFATPKDSKKMGFWDALGDSSTFVIVCHMGFDDGPILAYQDPALYISGDYTQPWSTLKSDHSKLDVTGKLFWSKTTQGRKDKLQIILLGCKSGVSYAAAVAKATQCDVYGFDDSAASGDWATMKPYLQAIKSGLQKKGMVKITG